MIKNRLTSLVLVSLGWLYLAPAVFAITENKDTGCFFNSVSFPSGKTQVAAVSLGCLGQIIVNVITLLITFIGFFTLLFLLIGAIRMVTSRGDAKALGTAKNTITYALIGMLLVVLSFVIINAVASSLGYPDLLTTFSLYLTGEKVAKYTGP